MGFYAIRRPKYLKSMTVHPDEEQLFPDTPVPHWAFAPSDGPHYCLLAKPCQGRTLSRNHRLYQAETGQMVLLKAPLTTITRQLRKS